MKFQRIPLLIIFLIVVSSIVVPQLRAQESERDRNRDEWQRPAEVFEAMGVKQGDRVADIGCGSGYFTFRLAARVGAEGKVYAVDIEPIAIQKVRQRKERENLSQVQPVMSESADPHLPTDLDSVLIVDSYHEFREYNSMMQTVFQAMKPGGRLVIIDGQGPQGRPRTEYHRLHVIPSDLVRKEIVDKGRTNRFLRRRIRKEDVLPYL